MVIRKGFRNRRTYSRTKRISDFGDTNDLVFMEVSCRHEEEILVAANYTNGWANELITILKEQFGRVVDTQVIYQYVSVNTQTFHNKEMLPLEDGNQA